MRGKEGEKAGHGHFPTGYPRSWAVLGGLAIVEVTASEGWLFGYSQLFRALEGHELGEFAPSGL